MGRWISDDGLFYWDGATWRPLGTQTQPPGPASAYTLPAEPRGRSPWPAILVGCAFIGVVVIVLAIVVVVLVVNNSDVQRSFCEGYTNNNLNVYCPFSPRPLPPSG